MAESKFVSLDSLSEKSWILAGAETDALLAKLIVRGRSLLELPAAMSRGTSTGNDEVYCLKVVDGGLRTRTGLPVEIEPAILRKPVWATDFTRFCFRPRNEEMLIFPYEIRDNGYRLLTEEELRTQYPATYAYLNSNRRLLEARKQFQAWYGFSAPRNLATHERADFLVPLLADRGLGAPLPEGEEGLCLMASGGFSVSLAVDCPVHPNFVLGLVNSRLLFWYLRQISNRFRGGWVTCTKQYFGTLPIALVDPIIAEEKRAYDQVVSLVEQVIGLNEKIKCARDPRERALLDVELEARERQLDRVVYELYRLSDEEVAMVEAAQA